jgi:hypothetical protein
MTTRKNNNGDYGSSLHDGFIANNDRIGELQGVFVMMKWNVETERFAGKVDSR